jgi:hypothetical protein
MLYDKTASISKKQKKTFLLDSLKALKTMGYLSSFDLTLISNKIESSE